MKPAITLRHATADDAEAIHSLIVELAAATGLPHKVSSKPADFREQGGERAFEALLAEQDGEAVGLALYFFTFSSWRGERGLYLQDLVVSKRVRGHGLGRRLLAATAAAALESGATHLRLSVDIDNTSAMRFYRGCGLGERSDERIYMIDGKELAGLAEAEQ